MPSLPIIVALVIAITFACFLLYPNSARHLLAELMRRRRLYIITHHGRREAEAIHAELRRKAVRKGIPLAVVEKHIEETGEDFAWRLGEQIANRRLGEPTPLERHW